MAELVLKEGREKSLLRRHPWIFSGAVDTVNGNPKPGETVVVLDSKKHFIAWAGYSPASQIRARVWSFEPQEKIDADFFARKIDAALALRVELGFYAPSSVPPSGLHPEARAVRLIHAESDLLPGLIVDCYGDVLVLQSLTAGMEFWHEPLADILLEKTRASAVYERSDADVRELEGLPVRNGPLRGNPPERIIINENGLQFVVDICHGHKTGFYLDQRLNRERLARLAAGREVLNCFCYTGGFSLHAAAAHASSVVSVDSSADALALARENADLNGLTESNLEWREDDVFQALRKFRDARRSFDLIILDPPKFAATYAQAEKAARGYKDINLLAFKLLRPGGILATFSCSGGVDAALFQKIVAGAALDAGVDASIVEHLEQAGDHPISLHFPEGAYLKGLICIKNG